MQITLNAIKYWCKLLTLEDSRYARKCYLQLYLHDESGRQNWVTEVRKLLCSIGFGHTWFYQSIGDRKLFLSCVKERLISISLQELNSSATTLFSPYLDYHPYPFAAPYVKVLDSYEERRIFALLHTNSLPINNNLVRFNLASDELCSTCLSIENEFHVLFQCTKYQDLRLKYLPSHMFNCSEINPLKS